MSRIEDALRRLRNQQSQSSSPSRPALNLRQASPQQAGHVAKQKVLVNGERHSLDQKLLAEKGLLAPIDTGPIADEFRAIKRPLIQNATREQEPAARSNVIMVASALPGAGKTFCSVNLAVSIAFERELNVLLVDADVSKPQLSREFGLGDLPGLIDLLLDDSRDTSEMLVRTDLNDIQVLPAGSRHPQATELLASERMSSIVDELANRYPDRIVIVDSPPLLVTSEAQALARQVGQIALVVEAGETTHAALLETLEKLDQDKAIGLIINKSRALWGDLATSYQGYYGYSRD